MKYDSAYLWEDGCEGEVSPISLVVQQAVIRRKELMLACVGEGKSGGETGITESGYFTEGLVEWFHKELLQLCERKLYEEIGKSLGKTLERLQKEIKHYVQKKGKRSNLHYAGMVCVGDTLWYFRQGDCRCYLLNKRYNRKHMKEIEDIRDTKGTSRSFLQGSLQRNLALLFCTSGYGSQMLPQEIAEVLIADGSCSEERMQKRLQELWQENVRRGERQPVGAVWVKT